MSERRCVSAMRRLPRASELPTQIGPMGLRFDFNDGCRVMLPETGHPWHVRPSDLDTEGLNVTTEQLHELLSIDVDGWLAEIPLIREHFERFGTHLPEGLSHELDDLDRRLRLSITKTGKLSRFGKVSRLGQRTERWPEDE